MVVQDMDEKRWMDWLFGLLGAALVAGPAVGFLFGCTGANPARGDQPGPLAALLGDPGPDLLEGAAGAAGEAPDASWGEIRPDLGLVEADAGELPADAAPDAGEAPDLLPLSAMHCEPFGGVIYAWMRSECAGLGEGAACDNRGQWDGEARCARFGIDWCRDNPRTSSDECFACAPCEARR